MLRQKMQSEAQIDLSSSSLTHRFVSFMFFTSTFPHMPSPLPCSAGAGGSDSVTGEKTASEGSQETKAAEEAEVQGPKVTLANGELWCVCVCVCVCVRARAHVVRVCDGQIDGRTSLHHLVSYVSLLIMQ